MNTNRTKSFGLLALVTIGILSGCVKNADPVAETPPSTTPPAPVTSSATRGGGGGIAPMGPNVGGITPIAGAESVGGGGGGGVGQAAKDMAKRSAASAGAPAGMGQAGNDGGE